MYLVRSKSRLPKRGLVYAKKTRVVSHWTVFIENVFVLGFVSLINALTSGKES